MKLLLGVLSFVALALGQDEYQLLTKLDRYNFFQKIQTQADNWLIVACHSGHWECTKQYNEYFRDKLMFSLSDEENLALGWVDTYLWSEFEEELFPET